MPKVRKQLTLDQKIDILDQLDGGARQIDLATKYGISAANVSIIKKDSTEIRVKRASVSVPDTKRFTYSKIDEAILAWITEKRKRGHPISSGELASKARSINMKLDGNPNFKVCFEFNSMFKQIINWFTISGKFWVDGKVQKTSLS